MPSALRWEVAREIAKAWISRSNRIPRFSPPPPDPHEDDLERLLLALRGPGLLEIITTLNAQLIHPFVTRRRMIGDARALGLSSGLAKRLLVLFRRAWGAPPLVSLTYAEQIERVALLLCSGGASLGAEDERGSRGLHG